jgi:hypothetical protein
MFEKAVLFLFLPSRGDALFSNPHASNDLAHLLAEHSEAVLAAYPQINLCVGYTTS